MIGNDWDTILRDETNKEYFINLLNFIKKEYQTKTIYPKQTEIFKAFRNTSYKDRRSIIIKYCSNSRS